MALLKTIFSAIVAVLVLSAQMKSVDAAPTGKIDKRLLLPTAPLASDVNGAHLIMKNDVDTTYIIKNAYMLLSQPRDYYSGMSACLSMGDGKRELCNRGSFLLPMPRTDFFLFCLPRRIHLHPWNIGCNRVGVVVE